jgi:hypothetical protein
MTSLLYLSLTCATRNSVYSAASLARHNPSSALLEASNEPSPDLPTFLDRESPTVAIAGLTR